METTSPPAPNVHIIARQTENWTILVSFTSEKLRGLFERNGLTWTALDGHGWAPPYLVARTASDTVVLGDIGVEELGILHTLRSPLRRWEWLDVFLDGHIKQPKFAIAQQLWGQDHCAYLLKVIQILKWSTVIACYNEKGNTICSHGQQVNFKLVGSEGGDKLTIWLQQISDGRTTSCVASWDLALYLPGMQFDGDCFPPWNPVKTWKWFKASWVDNATSSNHGTTAKEPYNTSQTEATTTEQAATEGEITRQVTDPSNTGSLEGGAL